MRAVLFILKLGLKILAVPVVLVVGSRTQVTLPATLADVDGLNALFRQHGLFAEGAEAWLSGKLLHPDSVVGIPSTQIFRLTRELQDAASGVPLDLPPAAVTARAASRRSSALRPAMATAAPLAARASAVARPIPLLPPVIRAVLPARSALRSTICP